MQLYTSTTTPFGRKVAVFGAELGLSDQLDPVLIDPWGDDSLRQFNPLGKIPVLVREEGSTLFESALICEYLAGLAGERGAALLPTAGAARIATLRQQALADGILGGGVARLVETRRPEDKRHPPWVARQEKAISGGIALLDGEASAGGLPTGVATLGACAVGACLGWIDFRHPDIDWRAEAPSLNSWFAAFAERESMRATVPFQA